MGYTGNAPKDITVTDPDGSSIPVSQLDDYQKQLRRVLIYGDFAVVTKTDDYTLTDSDCHVIFNGTSKTATLPQISTVASSSATKYYVITNINSSALTIAKNASDDTLPITSLEQYDSVILYADTNPATDIWRIRSIYKYKTMSVDTINERTAATGVTLDGVLCKDSGVTLNTGASAPIITNSTVVCTNLNADKVDGYNASATAAASTVVVSDSAGRADWNRPSFCAIKTSASQTGNADATFVQVQYGAEQWDDTGVYDTGAYRFTPNVAGKYLICAQCKLTADSSDGKYYYISLYKGGALFTQNWVGAGSTGADRMVSLTTIVDANGTSDYYEIYASVDTVSGTFSINLTTNTRDVFFSAMRIGV